MKRHKLNPLLILTKNQGRLISGGLYLVSFLLLEAFTGFWAIKTDFIFWAFVLHGIASLSLAKALWFLLPKTIQSDPKHCVLLVSSLNFFLPVVGATCILLALALLRASPETQPLLHIEHLELPDFSAKAHDPSHRYGHGGARARLTLETAPTQERTKALLATQSKPTPQGNRLLKQVMGDKNDELRLLAFSLMAKQEKHLQKMISQSEASLTQTHPVRQQALQHKRLAFLYWELIYRNLVQGELREQVMKKSKDHAFSALEHLVDRGSLWTLLGRIHLMESSEEDAKHAFLNALELQVSQTRVLPYLADFAYQAADFAELNSYLAQGTHLAMVPTIGNIAQFWNTHDAERQLA